MSNDKTTLADVQPGGRVRLGDQAERARFEQYRDGDFERDAQGFYTNSRTAQDWAMWQAALSAQPSPGGQDTLAMVRANLRSISDLATKAGGDRVTIANINCEVTHALQLLDLAARQPVGEEPLWCLHVLGMDDVHPAPSKAHAEKAAAWHNEQFKDQAARLGISIEAKVVPWPHSAESHSAGVAEFIPQWLIPQWQLDALEANAAPPAQAVDLDELRRVACTVSVVGQIDGHDVVRRNSVLDVIDNRRQRLIDSQAVGNG